MTDQNSAGLVQERLTNHEKICAERYEGIEQKFTKIETTMGSVLKIAFTTLISALMAAVGVVVTLLVKIGGG